MYKRTKDGIEIDSQAADQKPTFKSGGKSSRPSYIEQPKRESDKPAFGKKKIRKQKVAALIGKAKK